MNYYYYELADCVLSRTYPNKYVTSISEIGGSPVYDHTLLSQRVWLENEDGVLLLKNRFSGDSRVDIKEFMWIKLKSHQI
jgi:hypothetical protein